MSQLILPDTYGPTDALTKKVDDMVKTKLYRFYLDNAPKSEVIQWFNKREQSVDPSMVQRIYDKFKELETTHPLQMAEFRKRMGVQK